MIKKIPYLLLGLLFLVLVFLVSGGVAWSWYQSFLVTPIASLSSSIAPGTASTPTTPLSDQTFALPQAFLRPKDSLSEQRIFHIPVGATLQQVSKRLETEGLINSALGFRLLAYLEQQQNSIKAGEYALSPTMTPPELLARFTRGRSMQFPFTIIPGSSVRQVLDNLATSEIFIDDLQGLDLAEISDRVGIKDAHPEGWLFPDTYLFDRGTKASQILRRAHQLMLVVLSEEWQDRSPDLPIKTPYETLILASIIEKETGQGGERARIAGVFARRMTIGMRLQTDPTVIYGLGEAFDGNLRRADLEQPTPYNTYVIDGLPPTPIALPGREAIHAALHPEEGEALYFVARNDGTHHFSATLSQHNCAVRHYQRNRPCAQLQEQAP